MAEQALLLKCEGEDDGERLGDRRDEQRTVRRDGELRPGVDPTPTPLDEHFVAPRYEQ